MLQYSHLFNTVHYICRWLDTNYRSLVSDAAAKPTEPEFVSSVGRLNCIPTKKYFMCIKRKSLLMFYINYSLTLSLKGLQWHSSIPLRLERKRLYIIKLVLYVYCKGLMQTCGTWEESPVGNVDVSLLIINLISRYLQNHSNIRN